MTLTIGQVAARCGVGVETIRFYEREGLIAQPSRPASGFRNYPPDAVRRVQFIQQAKELGFSLREVKGLLSLRIESAATCDAVRARAEAKISDIEKKIGHLQEMRRALVKLTVACRGKGPASECPILEALGEAE